MGDYEQIIPEHKKLDRGDLFWLVYLFFFLIEPIDRHSRTLWLECIAELAVFIALYVWYLRVCSQRTRAAALCGMALLGYFAYPRNGGSTCFLIYAAALLPFITSSLPWIISAMAVEICVLVAEAVYFHASPYSWVSSALLIFGIGGSNVFFSQKERADRKLRMKQEEIEALAAVAERERIARDLHDVLGHTLSVIVLKSELAGRLLQRELTASTALGETLHLERAQAEINDVERTARTALAEVREAIGGYRARGLAAEIEAARQILRSAGVVFTTEGDLPPSGLSAAEETVLALALREAVTNIVRHAKASACTLRLRLQDGRYRLSIQDDGRHREVREGNGLRGMRERVESLGGQLLLTREAGTCLQIELPVRAAG